MIRILPITILFLLAFGGFIGFKSYNNAVAEQQTDKIIAQLSQDLNQLEPSAGTEEKKSEKEEKPEADKDGKKAELPAYVNKERPAENIPELTKSGKDLLQQMATRRSELDEWKKDLDLRASLVEASSKKLDDKIVKLEALKATTQKLLNEYKTEEDKKLKSMVKVYENMKPKDAAKVFDQLEMPVLLEIVGQMSERRLSAILAKMNGETAKQVTEKLMANRKLTKL